MLIPEKGPASIIIGSIQGVILKPVSGYPGNLGIYSGITYGSSQNTITWLKEGDYTPSLTIVYNDSSVSTIPYPDNAISVYSPLTIEQEQYDRVNTILSVALFTFALFGSAEVITKVWRWGRSSVKSEEYKYYDD